MASAIWFGASDAEDPFAKVKGLISDMIERLHADATADDSHKALSDKAMSETNAKSREGFRDCEVDHQVQPNVRSVTGGSSG